MSYVNKAAVLFLVFNRPDKTQAVFERIRDYQPERIYIHADGPRPDNHTDLKNCNLVKNYINSSIDWRCEIKTFFREVNAGCGRGPAEAITWFFEHEDEGIIIEDDCLPHPDFFDYCRLLLEKYRNNPQILYIGASTYEDKYPCKHSYTFTRYGTMAAWATWKRTWLLYSFKLNNFTREELKSALVKNLHSSFEQKTWLGLYDWIVEDNFSSYWDWQVHFMLFFHNGLAIRPCSNLISNIGAGSDATHTQYEDHNNFKAFRPVQAILPLVHPDSISVNKKADSKHYKNIHQLSLLKRVKIIIYKLFYQTPMQKNS